MCAGVRVLFSSFWRKIVKIILTILFCLLIAISLFARIYINEIDYDQPGTDDREFIELAGPDGASPDGYEMVLVR